MSARILEWMATGRIERFGREMWQHTSALMATILNLFSSTPIPFDTFNPYAIADKEKIESKPRRELTDEEHLERLRDLKAGIR